MPRMLSTQLIDLPCYGILEYYGLELQDSYLILIEDGHPSSFKGSHEHLYRMKGVVQGDPLSMFIYAATSLYLVKQLENNDNLVT